MSLHFISCLLLLTDAPPGAAILLSDFGAFSISHPLALALHMSLTLAKYLGCTSSTSTSPSDADVSRVQDTPAGDIALAAYNLKISWNIVIDGDYILDNVANSIRDGVYACVPTSGRPPSAIIAAFLPEKPVLHCTTLCVRSDTSSVLYCKRGQSRR